MPSAALRTASPRRQSSSHQATLAELDAIARLLDTKWRIPFTGIRFGLDAVVGLVPGLGDAATGLVSAYIVFRSLSLGVPAGLLARMIFNILFDTLVGSIPLLGSVFDVFFKSNIRNMALLRRHLESGQR